jgi:hypothetical protein
LSTIWSLCPLRFLTGTEGHLTPVAMVRRNATKDKDGSLQSSSGSSTAAHHICGETGREEVSDAAFGWLWH